MNCAEFPRRRGVMLTPIVTRCAPWRSACQSLEVWRDRWHGRARLGWKFGLPLLSQIAAEPCVRRAIGGGAGSRCVPLYWVDALWVGGAS